MTDEGESLAVRSLSGDRSAFEALIRRNSRWIYAQLYLETGDRHRAEDLTQETFLTAWRRITELHDAAAFRGWLAAIARRTLLDSLKHEKRKKRRALKPTANQSECLTPSSLAPDAVAQLTEERARAMAILRDLPEEYRSPLMLRFIAGADYAQIAEQLALTNGSLRGLLQRGMALLRQRMNAGE